MALGDWKSVRSDLTLPLDDKPASQFQYKRFIHWEVDLIGVGIAGRTATGSWHIQLVSPTNAVLFEQKVTLTLWVVYTGTVGLQIFTWAFRSEKIETPIVAGTATGENNPSWSYTLGGTEQSEFGILDPGGGSDYTDLTAIIEAEWLSPVYKMRVPPGTKLKIIRDAWGLGASTRPEWKFRFVEGDAPKLDTRFDRFGALLFARGVSDVTETVQMGRSWPQHQIRDAGATLVGTDPTIIELPDGREILGILTASGYIEYESLNSEWTWKRVEYPDDEKGFGTKPYAVWPAGVLMPKMIVLDDAEGGTRLSIAVQGDDLLCKRIGREGIAETVVVGDADSTQEYSLSSDGKGLVQISDLSGLPKWESSNGGNTWAPVNVVVTV